MIDKTNYDKCYLTSFSLVCIIIDNNNSLDRVILEKWVSFQILTVT